MTNPKRQHWSDVLEELGHRLTENDDRHLAQSWERFLQSDPTAAAQAAELEVLTTEPVLPHGHVSFPGASGPARSHLWQLSGSRHALDLSMDLWRRWVEHDPTVLEHAAPWDRHGEDVLDDMTYLLFLHRLPSPAETPALTREEAMAHAVAWLSGDSSESAVEALDAVQDPATAERWLVLIGDAQGADQVKMVEYGHLSDVNLRPERFDQPEARLKAFGYPVSVNREGEGR